MISEFTLCILSLCSCAVDARLGVMKTNFKNQILQHNTGEREQQTTGDCDSISEECKPCSKLFCNEGEGKLMMRVNGKAEMEEVDRAKMQKYCQECFLDVGEELLQQCKTCTETQVVKRTDTSTYQVSDICPLSGSSKQIQIHKVLKGTQKPCRAQSYETQKPKCPDSLQLYALVYTALLLVH